MYRLINRNVADILKYVGTKNVKTYSELLADLNNTDVSKDVKYRKRYHGFWKMRFPSNRYREAYFDYLEKQKKSSNITPKAVCLHLREASRGEKGNDIIQFSFATKLAHMVNQTLPIYDDRVSAFFFLREPETDPDFNNRLQLYSDRHEFLKREYGRVLADGLLQPSIRAFRRQFHEYPHSNVKTIDWLIWAFVSLAREERFLSGKFQYQ